MLVIAIWRWQLDARRLAVTCVMIPIVFTAGCSKTGEPIALSICDEPSFDVGKTLSRQHFHTFELRNNTRDTVRIVSMGRSCSCVSHILETEELLPGDVSQLEMGIEVRPRLTGAITRFAEHLWINVEGYSEPILFEVKGTYVPPIYCKRVRIREPVQKIQSDRFKLDQAVFVSPDRKLDNDSFECVGPLKFSAEVAAVTKHYDDTHDLWQVRLEGPRPSLLQLPVNGILRIRCSSSERTDSIELPVSIYDSRADSLVFDQKRIAFGVVAASSVGDVRRHVAISWPASDALRIANAVCDQPGIRVAVSEVVVENSQRTQQVECSLDRDIAEGPIVGNLTVTVSNDSSQEERVMTFPISGFIAAANGEIGAAR